MERYDIAIVGGGLIGCAVARESAQAGFRTALFERGRVGGEASSAAAGMLGVQADTHSEVMLRLGAESRALFPAWLAALRGESDIDVEFWRAGTLALAFDEGEESALAARCAWQAAAGFPSEMLSAAAARALEPGLSVRVRAAARFGLDGRVDNATLTQACAQAARRAGCAVFEDEAVVAVAVEGGRVQAIQTAVRRVACDVAINAAGAWAAALAGGTPLPIEPVRGQMAVLQAARPPFRHAIDSARGYAVARRDGRVLLGSTLERAAYTKSVTAGGLGQILAAGLELSPALGALPFAGAWSGLRPATPDGLPIIGRDPAVGGYLVATGHYRNGILLAPLTARLVLALLRGETPAALEPLRPERFAAPAACVDPLPDGR